MFRASTTNTLLSGLRDYRRRSASGPDCQSTQHLCAGDVGRPPTPGDFLSCAPAV